MDPATITTSSFTLAPPNGSTLAASVSYDASSKTASLTPSAALAMDTVYTAKLDTTVKSSAGVALAAAFSWSFKTDPVGSGPVGPTGIALDARAVLAWQPITGATAYNVYRGTTLTTINTAVTPPGGVAAPQTSFADTTAVNNTTYYYSAFVDTGAGTIASAARSLAARPENTVTGPVRWIYHTTASSMTRPALPGTSWGAPPMADLQANVYVQS